MEISSRLIQEITYDAATQTLDVKLRLKGRRRYFNVPPAVVKNLLTAPSPGWYYTQHIHHAFARTDDEPPPRFSFFRLRLRRHPAAGGVLRAETPRHQGTMLPAWLQKLSKSLKMNK
ncbi:KTSC domain-containing protein [Rhizobium sp. WYJ-E13]|uniref:KTSC domain-containing protein n=1 Tax=Rhizobium sp. WYJ-E13 TaxID=2849093 RepID=UPI001C1EF5F6|nr:KTSC domain-containing protein [Rhizobium sp. WYJ-E13]QWW70025.1 KTSC domain-containing protein [Rhizobium sp. WYJ-E13]